MKNVMLIGVGNCGSQVACLGEKLYPTLFDAMYINTSKTDLSMVTAESELKYKIGSDEDVEGSGKNRTKMQEYLEKDIEKILGDEKLEDSIIDKSYAFIITSAAGGTGSGASTILYEFMKEKFPDTFFILVGVLPKLDSTSLMEHGNTLEFLDDLYRVLGDNVTYTLYDNESTANMADTVALETVNRNIIEDIRILTGIDNHPTPYESIDKADMESIITTPGRLLVARINKNLTEKNLEDNNIDNIVIKAIKDSCHVETDRNKHVVRWGIITYFTNEVYQLYKSSLTAVTEFLGIPKERFNHNAINNKDESLSFMYMIASGLSPINDRVKKITSRVESLQKTLPSEDTNKYILGEGVSYGIMEERRKQVRREAAPSEINKSSVFNKFKK